MDERLSQEQQHWLESCVKDINEGDNLFRLFESLKPIMRNKMRKYLRDIPHYDEEDYFQIGLITLWDNIERLKNNPGIAERFLSYYAVSVEHAYAKVFYEYVMNNDPVFEVSADYGNGYNIVQVRSFQAYRDKIARKRKECYEARKSIAKENARKKQEQKILENERKEREKERRRKHYAEHKDEINKRRREWRAANTEEARHREKLYRDTHHEAYLKRMKRYRKENAERINGYEIARRESKYEYHRKYCDENREKINEYRRKYYEEHKEEINRKRRKAYKKKKAKERNISVGPELTKSQQYSQNYYREHREACIKRSKEYYYKHREEILKKWKAERDMKRKEKNNDENE